MTTTTIILLALIGCVAVAAAAAVLWRPRPPVPPARPSRVRAALDDTGDQVDATVFPSRPTVHTPPDRPAA